MLQTNTVLRVEKQKGEDPVTNTLQTSRDKCNFRRPRKHCAGDVFHCLVTTADSELSPREKETHHTEMRVRFGRSRATSLFSV